MLYDTDIYKRVFVALKFPHSVLKRIQSINACIDDRVVRKAKSSSFHLTLHFFGETEISQVKFIHSELMNNLGHLAPLKLKLDTIGSFPKSSNAKVIWLGVNGDLCELNYIQSQISKSARKLGLEIKVEKFMPHITLARVREGNKLKQKEVFLKNIKIVKKSILDSPVFEGKSIVIINSVQYGNGYQYNEIGSIYLNNQAC